MSDENFCNIHGPYPASFGSCPMCGGRPAAPQSLSDMEEDTMVGGGYGFSAAAEEDATQVGSRDSSFFGGRGDDETQIAGDQGHTQIERHRSGADAILWVKEGARRGRWYPIYNNTTIGRKKAEIILDDERVSAMHAKFTIDKNAYLVWDFGSSNGTFVNGKRIREATALQENDRIKIGESVFLLKLLVTKKKPSPSSRSRTAKSGTAKKTSTATKGKKTGVKAQPQSKKRGTSQR